MGAKGAKSLERPPRYFLIHHPKRDVYGENGLVIYHDPFGGNEDPYIWNERFLHSFCHITEMPKEEGYINFWVSLDGASLYCDCVFCIEEKKEWKHPNAIRRTDKIVENDQTFAHHYRHGNLKKNEHHYLNKKRRYTLKASANGSFQPQDGYGHLIDISGFLIRKGLPHPFFEKGKKPVELSSLVGKALYKHLCLANMKLTGKEIQHLHPYRNKIVFPKSNVC